MASRNPQRRRGFGAFVFSFCFEVQGQRLFPSLFAVCCGPEVQHDVPVLRRRPAGLRVGAVQLPGERREREGALGRPALHLRRDHGAPEYICECWFCDATTSLKVAICDIQTVSETGTIGQNADFSNTGLKLGLLRAVEIFPANANPDIPCSWIVKLAPSPPFPVACCAHREVRRAHRRRLGPQALQDLPRVVHGRRPPRRDRACALQRRQALLPLAGAGAAREVRLGRSLGVVHLRCGSYAAGVADVLRLPPERGDRLPQRPVHLAVHHARAAAAALRRRWRRRRRRPVHYEPHACCKKGTLRSSCAATHCAERA
eukprot:gene82-biopygen23